MRAWQPRATQVRSHHGRETALLQGPGVGGKSSGAARSGRETGRWCRWCRWQLTLRDPEWIKYVLAKGFVAVNGCSLTVGEVGEDWFSVYLIPETLRVTTFGCAARLVATLAALPQWYRLKCTFAMPSIAGRWAWGAWSTSRWRHRQWPLLTLLSGLSSSTWRRRSACQSK